MSKQRNETRFKEHLLNFIQYFNDNTNNEAKLILNRELAQAYDHFGTLLHYAADVGNKVIAKKLLELGAEVDHLDKLGKTPLMLAVTESRCSKTVEILLNANANIFIANKLNQNSLMMAFELGHSNIDIIQLFIRKLGVATLSEKELTEKLITHGCNISHAAVLSNISLLHKMLELGIDVNSENRDRKTALFVAADWNDYNMMKWLIKNGANVNIRDIFRSTALMRAAENLNKDTMKILLDNGADYDARNYFGHTSLYYVFTSKHKKSDEDFLECVELIFENGASHNNPITAYGGIFNCILNGSNDKKIKTLVSYIALAQSLETSITKIIMYWEHESKTSKLPKIKKYYNACLQVLEISEFNNVSLFYLLHISETSMIRLVRNKTFIPVVEQVCSEHKLEELFPFYYYRLMKRIAIANRIVKLEDKVIAIFCKIFDVNLCYFSIRNITSYLNEQDLENLLQL